MPQPGAIVDATYRVLYRIAHRGRQVYFRLCDPERHGTLVALWYAGKIVLIKSSYADYYSLPGGYAKRGEAPASAAAREVREEVGVAVSAAELALRADLSAPFRGRLSIFEHELVAEPRLVIDQREIVEAALVTPSEALSRALFPALRELIAGHSALEPSGSNSTS